MGFDNFSLFRLTRFPAFWHWHLRLFAFIALKRGALSPPHSLIKRFLSLSLIRENWLCRENPLLLLSQAIIIFRSLPLI